MNKFFKYIFTTVLILGFLACEDDEQNVTDLVQETVETGAVLRTLNDPGENPPLVLGASDSSYLIQIEEQDELEGDLLQSVDVFVRFSDLTVLSAGSITGAGQDLSSPADPDADVLLRTIPASEFVDGPFGLPRTDIVITEADLASVLTINDLSSNDQIEIRLGLNLTDGRVFSSNNAGGIITAGFFNSPFAYVMDIDSGIAINYLDENNNTFVTLDGFDNTYFVLAEITDQDNGANVQSLNVYTRFVDNNDDGVDLTATETLFTSFGAADFGTSPDGFPTADVTITPMELLGALTADQVSIGDQFFVRYEVITNDGRTITDEVESGNFYDLIAATDCPFPPLDETQLDSFVGDYVLTQGIASIFGYNTFSAPGNDVVTLFAEVSDDTQTTPGFVLTNNQRSVDADYIAQLAFGNTLTYGIEFNLCEVTIFEGAGSITGGTGLACAGVNIDLGPAEGGFYNAADDSAFTLILQDDIADACGQGATFPTVMFTQL